MTKDDGSTEIMSVRRSAEYHECDKLVEFLDEYKVSIFPQNYPY